MISKNIPTDTLTDDINAPLEDYEMCETGLNNVADTTHSPSQKSTPIDVTAMGRWEWDIAMAAMLLAKP